MNSSRLLESLNTNAKGKIQYRRYSLSEIISESYKAHYSCKQSATNMKSIIEAHLEDVRKNPNDIERLSRQLCKVKHLVSMVESKKVKDEELLVPEEKHDTVEFQEERLPESTPATEEGAQIDIEEDAELTDDELAELKKHLSSIRKEKKAPVSAPKEEIEEAATSKARKVHRKDVKIPDTYVNSIRNSSDRNDESSEPESKEKRLKESIDGISINDIQYVISDLNLLKEEMENNSLQSIRLSPDEYGLDRFVCFGSRGYLDLDHLYNYIEADEDDENYYESRSYSNLSEFSKKSSGKAFVKTFKKLDTKLREGTALTRQESISLYKAANSAMTHLSVELEHNPEFLSTFKESTTLLSIDISKLLDSMKRGKAPSKANMKSLAKFSEALLNEGKVYYPNGQVCSDDSVDMDKALDYMYGTDRDSDNSKFTTEEKQKAVTYWVEKTDKMYEEEELPPVEDEEDNATEEETSEESTESEEFDQEYADARVELHKDLAAEHAESEEPEVQEKLAQDAEEVLGLPGVTEEQAAEIEATNQITTEEAPEEEIAPPEESSAGEDPEEEIDDDDITEEELAELKKHLMEMRKAKASKKSTKAKKLTESLSKSDKQKILQIIEDQKRFNTNAPKAEDSYDENDEFVVVLGNSNPTYIADLESDLVKLESENIGYEKESNDNGFYAYNYRFFYYED